MSYLKYNKVVSNEDLTAFFLVPALGRLFGQPYAGLPSAEEYRLHHIIVKQILSEANHKHGLDFCFWVMGYPPKLLLSVIKRLMTNGLRKNFPFTPFRISSHPAGFSANLTQEKKLQLTYFYLQFLNSCSKKKKKTFTLFATFKKN